MKNIINVTSILLFFLFIFPQYIHAELTYDWDASTGTLTITDDADGDIVITRETSPPYTAVLVNGKWIDDGTGDSIHADNVKKIIVIGGPGDNLISLGDVNHDTFPNMNNTEINGGAGDDTMIGSDFNDEMSGGEGDDFLSGGEGNDELNGGDGYDTLLGDDGNDKMHGGEGDDTLLGGDGNDELHGGEGDDQLHGDLGDDTLVGGNSEDDLNGGDGDDTLLGGDGNDRFKGGRGDDKLYGGPGDDWLNGGKGDDKIYGSELNDHYYQNPGSTDILNDSTGVDTLDFSPAELAILIDLDLLNTVQTVNYDNDSINLEGIFENFIGSPFDDVVHVNPLDVPRSIDGGGSVNGDTIYVETMGETPSDDGTAVTIPGFEPITYTSFTEVIFENALSIDGNQKSPESFELNQNYPNPFNPVTTIEYNIQHDSHVTIEIFDLNGNLIDTLLNNFRRIGTYSINWDGKDYYNKSVSSGTYIYRLKSNGEEISKKMILIR